MELKKLSLYTSIVASAFLLLSYNFEWIKISNVSFNLFFHPLLFNNLIFSLFILIVAILVLGISFLFYFFKIKSYLKAITFELIYFLTLIFIFFSVNSLSSIGISYEPGLGILIALFGSFFVFISGILYGLSK